MIVVAGHLCLDIIPAIGTGSSLQPGRLVEVGPANIATGGAVSNVGIALHKLGTPVRLIGKVGQDAFGGLVLDVLRKYGADEFIIKDPQGETSYTIVVSSAGQDRMFLHCPGSNDTFIASDVSDASLNAASHLHFGYPSLMASMSANGGEETESLFKRAKAIGLTTSLDMSYPDVSSIQGLVDWPSLLDSVLPHVDVFLPSEPELSFMLPNVFGGVEALASACLTMGTGVVVIKRGTDGLFAQSAGADRLGSIGRYVDSNEWANQRLTQSIYPVEVVGTTGAGDTTIAGFLYGLVSGFTFQKCLAAGCAVGAMSVEGPDAVSGIMPWNDVAKRFGF